MVSTEFHQPNGLRAALDAAGGSMQDLTVLAPQNDQFRLDTPSRHRDGVWLADRIAALKLVGPRHLRGLHYVMIGQPKPNGLPYNNTDEDWQWLGMSAKAARWLGYLPFDRIIDQRNDEPEVRLWTPSWQPQTYVSLDYRIALPDDDDLTPRAMVTGFTADQPYHLVLVGEKSSLREVLGDVANEHGADLYLPTGEISDTQAYQMARLAVRDGRPMVILYFSDCDPSGWQMPISLTRKLQALQVIEFPEMEFEVHRVALVPDQVREYGLPSTPLKATEKRADRWTDAMGVEQTEIDALAALQPDLLRDIATEALKPFYDTTLDSRVAQAKRDWRERAQAAIDDQVGADLELLRADALAALDAKAAEIQTILDEVEVDADQFDLPEPVVPEADLDPDREMPEPLCDSRWTFAEQCERLIASKNYEV